MVEKQNDLVTSSPCNGAWGAAGDAGWPKAVRRIEIWSGESQPIRKKAHTKVGCEQVSMGSERDHLWH